MKRIAESPVQSERSKDQRFTSPMASTSYAGALRGSRRPPPTSARGCCSGGRPHFANRGGQS